MPDQSVNKGTRPRRDGMLLGASSILISIAVYVRYAARASINDDMQIFYRWYDSMQAQGFPEVLGRVITNYPPAYNYLLMLAAFVSPLSRTTSIKLIPFAFDVISAFMVYKIIRLKYSNSSIPILASSLFLLLPSVVLVGAVWGQTDGIYSAFILLCLYYLLTSRPLPAVIAFSAAFSFKFQAIFVVPFLAVLTLKKVIPARFYLLIPAVYLGLGLPSLLFGYPLSELLLIYARQSDQYSLVARSAPNLYSYLLSFDYTTVFVGGMILAVLLIAAWVFWTSMQNPSSKPNGTIFLMLVSSMLAPFLLPKMHERYFYLTGLLSFIFAFYEPRYWFLALLSQMIICYSLTPFLFGAPVEVIYLTSFFNLILVAYLLYAQHGLRAEARFVE